MARVLSNNVSLSYSIETALGVAGTSWFQLEPNDITTFGATITKVARNPISRQRDRRKGVVTDLDSAVEFETDLTGSAFDDFVEGFCFSTAVNSEMDIASTLVSATGDEYTVPSLSATQAGKLQFSTGEYASLIFARGFTNDENNGVKEVDVDAVSTDTVIGVVETLVDETPPANAELQLAGVRFADAATDVTVAYTGTTLTITVAALVGFDWSTMGLTVGQTVHVGGTTDDGTVQNALQDSVADDTYGYARITAIDTNVLTLDKTSSTLKVAAPVAATVLDIMFGKFIRNVAVDSSEYLERSFQIEAVFPDLDAVGSDEYQYAKGNFVNTVGVNLPLTDKATVSFAMIGTDTDNPTTVRATGADSAEAPNATAAFGTSSDIARIQLQETDEDDLGTCFKSLTLNINNNVSPEKVIGTLGGKFINTGDFEIDIETQLIFENGAIIDAIRTNETLTMDFIVKNEDGAIIFDVPSMTIDGGGRDFPENETVLVNTTAQAFLDPVFGYSLGVSRIPKVPT